MTLLHYANLWSSTLTGAITSASATCSVVSTAGSPDVPFVARIKAEGGNLDELVLVTSKTGTLSITRACEAIGDGSQAAQAHASGAVVEAVLSAALLDQLTAIAVAAGVPAGAPVGSLPIAVDTTAVTGGVYVWDGGAWVKAASI